MAKFRLIFGSLRPGGWLGRKGPSKGVCCDRKDNSCIVGFYNQLAFCNGTNDQFGVKKGLLRNISFTILTLLLADFTIYY